MKNIIIADDHQVLLDGLEYMLESIEHVQIVARCTNGAQVLHRLAEQPVDLVILDINMPRMNGIQVTEEIKKKYPDVKIIALSMHDQASFVNRMINLGAEGYILKDDGKESILNAVETILSGGTYLSERTRHILRKQKSAYRKGPGLTEREKQVLSRLAKGRTSAEISEDLHISYHTVKTHRRHLLRKFDVNNVTSLLSEARQRGII